MELTSKELQTAKPLHVSKWLILKGQCFERTKQLKPEERVSEPISTLVIWSHCLHVLREDAAGEGQEWLWESLSFLNRVCQQNLQA